MLRPLSYLASELIAETRRLDQRTTSEITTAVQASDSTLTQLCGIGNLVAGKILAWPGSIPPLETAHRFALRRRQGPQGRAPMGHSRLCVSRWTECAACC